MINIEIKNTSPYAHVGNPSANVFTPFIKLIISGIVKYAANKIPRNDTTDSIFAEVRSHIAFMPPERADINNIVNNPNPNQHAGYPRKTGQGSLKKHADVINLTALK